MKSFMISLRLALLAAFAPFAGQTNQPGPSRWLLVLVASSVLLSPAAPGQVHFGLEDYATLGNIRDRVAIGIDKIDLNDLNLTATVDWLGVLFQVVDATSQIARVENWKTAAATLAGVVKTVVDAGQASTTGQVSAIAGALSPIQTGGIEQSLEALADRLRNANLADLPHIEQPSWEFDEAVVVSGHARAKAMDERDGAAADLQSVNDRITSLGQLDAGLLSYDSQLQVARQGLAGLVPTLNILLYVPVFNLAVYYQLLNDVIEVGEIQIPAIQEAIGHARTRIPALITRLMQLKTQLETYILNVNAVLNYPPLTSSWVTSADVGVSNPYFVFEFQGYSFDYPYTEIDGWFSLGILTITNLKTPGGGGNTYSAGITFAVQRTVHDPVLGEKITPASVVLPMGYYASPNTKDGDPCGASRDYFVIPDLGEEAFICEKYTAYFEIFAEYSSPLRIVAMHPVPGPQVDPMPSVVSMAYPVHVSGGTGSGVYTTGAIVPVVAQAPSGKEFLCWQGDTAALVDRFAAATSLTVGTQTLEVRAAFRTIPTRYTLGVAGGSGGGVYTAGTDVGINAVVPAGMQFAGWIGDTSGLRNAAAASTSVTMTRNMAVVARFVPRDDCPNDPNKTSPGICGCGRSDVDSDDDGVPDCIDPCPHSDMRPTIFIGSCDTHVPNRVLGGGCWMADVLAKLRLRYGHDDDYRNRVSQLAETWRAAGLITLAQKKSIVGCAQ